MSDKLDEAALQGIATEFLRTSLGAPGSDVALIRERNLRAYNAEPSGEFAPPDIDDRSQFVSADVADTIDGMMPQLLDAFVSDDKAVECVAKKPNTPTVDYDKMAQDATGYLNHLFYDRNEGLNILHDWIQDAALQKVGYVQVWVEEEQQDNERKYDGQTPDNLAAIMADGATLKGDPQVAEDGTLTFTTEDRSVRKQYKVACVAPYQMRVASSAKWGDEPAAIGRVWDRPAFELEEEGYDLEDIGGYATVTLEADGQARASLGDTPNSNPSELTPSHKLYEYAELYIRLDLDGDGTAEWVQLCLINGQLVSHEEVDDHPYAEICLMPRAHAYYGDCPADRAYQIQKEQTNLSRALFDNIYFSVNQRTYVNTSAQVNINDLLDNRPGGIVRGQGEPGKAFGLIPTAGIPATTFNVQEWLANRLENRTGFTRYSQGTDGESLNKTATGVSIITSKSDMRLRLMTRFAAHGIKRMFQKLLKLATEHQDQQDWYRVNGERVTVQPMEWRDQFDLTVNVGLGHGTRDQQMQRLMAMVPLQQMGAAMGVVGPTHVAHTIRTAATINEFKNPDQFADEQPSGMPNPQQYQQQKQQALQSIQDLNQKLQASQQENLKLQIQVQDKAAQLHIQAATAQAQHDLATQKAHLDAHHKGQQTVESELSIADLQSQINALQKTIQFFTQQAQPAADDPTGAMQ